MIKENQHTDQIAGFLKNPDLELALKIFSTIPLLMLPTIGLLIEKLK
ncbi:hypothetical protein FACS189451_12090 [Bacteroidia bacterium]|nr:hypothetical protein FACS189451_12090 [Bacteroidia bacterium]